MFARFMKVVGSSIAVTCQLPTAKELLALVVGVTPYNESLIVGSPRDKSL